MKKHSYIKYMMWIGKRANEWGEIWSIYKNN